MKKGKFKRIIALIICFMMLVGNTEWLTSVNAATETQASPTAAAEEVTESVTPEVTPKETPTAVPETTPEATPKATPEAEDKEELPVLAAPESEAVLEETAEDTENTNAEDAAAEEEYDPNLDYVLGRPMTEEELAAQAAMVPENTSYHGLDDEAAPLKSRLRRATALDSKYDGRAAKVVTSARNQGGYNTCWAFSAIAMAETSMIKNGVPVNGVAATAGNTDMSEFHTSYFCYNRPADPLGNTVGDSVTLTNGSNFKTAGGNIRLQAYNFANSIGAEQESVLPYASISGAAPDASLAYNHVAALKNAYFINKDNIKAAVAEFGAVGIGMYYMADSQYNNPNTAAYCCNDSVTINHAVTIVGWDDQYSKANFPSTSEVKNDGAWIVKNSYGTGYGDQGFFYLSYEDVTISEPTALEFQEGDAYQHNYQYDGTASTLKRYVENGGKVANVYQIKGSSDQRDEILKAVSIVLRTTQVNYKIQIYKNPSNKKNPESGTPMLSTAQEGSTTYEGIYTIELNEEVRLSEGDNYSIVFTLSSPYESKVYYGLEETHDYGWFRVDAATALEQSFEREVGYGWGDLKTIDSCARIKGFTVEAVGKTILDSAETVNYKEIELNWQPTEDVSGYEIYRSTKSGSGYSVIADVSSGDITSYTDKDANLLYNQTYYYKVRAYVVSGAETKIKGPYSVVKEAKTKLAPIINPSALALSSVAPVNYNEIKIAWSKSQGASGYELYRSTSPNSGYALISTISSGNTLSWADKTVLPGTAYYYKVRAFATGSAGEKAYSEYTAVKSAQSVLGTTTVKAASASYNAIKVTWSKVTGASGYEIYRSTKSNTGYALKATVNNANALSWTDKPNTGTTYYYKIRVFTTGSTGAKVYSAYSAVQSAKAIPATPTVKTASASYSSIKITWSKVTGASGYQVYRSGSAGGKYTLVKTITKGSTLNYTDGSRKTGTTYYYKIRAYRTVNGAKVYGAYSTVKSGYAKLNKVSLKSAKSASKRKIKLTWGKVSGASGYVIYRATKSGGTYKKVKTITKGSTITYTNGSLKKGKYYYKIRAYRKVGSKKIYGAYSTVKSARAK